MPHHVRGLGGAVEPEIFGHRLFLLGRLAHLLQGTSKHTDEQRPIKKKTTGKKERNAVELLHMQRCRHLKLWKHTVVRVQLGQTSYIRKTRPSNKPLFKQVCISRAAQIHETPTQKAPCYRLYDLPGCHTLGLADLFSLCAREAKLLSGLGHSRQSV